MKLLSDKNDYPLPLHRRAVRSLLFRSGLLERLGRPFWREVEIAPYISKHDARNFDMFTGMPIDFHSPQINQSVGDWTAKFTPFHECRWTIEDALVEPDRCLIIGPDGRLIRLSRRSTFLPQFPNALRYKRRRKVNKIEEAIVYDGRQSNNYFHHIVDGLINLAFQHERTSIPRDLPLIVNRWIYDSPFFADLRNRSPVFAGLNWLVQEPDTWLHVERAHFMNAAQFQKSYWTAVRNLYPQLSKPRGRRIFVSRDSRMYSRALTNQQEVIALLERHGFETLYAEHCTVEEQQRAFEECEVLVALHGMAVIQQMFMDPKSAKVLEIMPKDRIHHCYVWQAWVLEQRGYDMVLGSDLNTKGNYTVDCALLERRLLSLLDRSQVARVFGNASV